ncbi:hypothetical protein KI688_000890 [Linnemannia hyalina]|uniref:DUF4246 domain-containing protein n=1 Tax=Linnemannia hyalina TaxID=64524 RepID=A0A9P8BZ11_9FUNG|nr:hypothetical protein KI688_000890 [Linnemannia hyalina]
MEILAVGLEREVRYQLGEDQLDCIFKELEWHAQRHRDQIDKTALVPIDIGIQGMRRSDGLIPEELGGPPLDFITAGKVLDVVPAPKSSAVDSTFYSKKHQWLPTDLGVSPEGKVKAKSYINNLHPVEHKEMYPVLEETLDKVLLMFEGVLSAIEAFPFKVSKLKESRDCLRTQYKPLQTVVKLANIELTPNNQVYAGGTWHDERMANENIVATGIYYYNTENIGDSRLAFSIQIKEPKCEQSDDRGAEHLYDVMNKDALIQYMDGITTQQDRCVVFPNIYQHQEQSFGLADRTKPESRKLLAFFLVSPEEPVLSTTFVPPQQ